MSQMSETQKRRVAKMVAAKMVCGNIDLLRVIKGYVVYGPTPLARAFKLCYTPYVINLLQYPKNILGAEHALKGDLRAQAQPLT